METSLRAGHMTTCIADSARRPCGRQGQCNIKFDKLQFKKAAAPEGMQKKRTAALGLDNPLKIHYTTNRKGAELQDGQLLPEIKKIDRMVWKTWRSIFFVIIVVSLRKFFRDLNGQTYHVHDQPQQAENDHEKRKKLRQIHATSLPSPQGSGKSLSKKFHSRGLLRSIVDGNQSPGRTHDHLHCRQRPPPLRAARSV